MYGIYGNIHHQYTPNVSIYGIHGSYGIWKRLKHGGLVRLGTSTKDGWISQLSATSGRERVSPVAQKEWGDCLDGMPQKCVLYCITHDGSVC